MWERRLWERRLWERRLGAKQRPIRGRIAARARLPHPSSRQGSHMPHLGAAFTVLWERRLGAKQRSIRGRIAAKQRPISGRIAARARLPHALPRRGSHTPH